MLLRRNQKANLKRQKAKVSLEAKPFFLMFKGTFHHRRKSKEKIKCRPFAFCTLPFAF